MKKISKLSLIASLLLAGSISNSNATEYKDIKVNSLGTGVPGSEITSGRGEIDLNLQYVVFADNLSECTTIVCADEIASCKNKPIVLMPNHSHYDEMFSVLLSAHMNGKSINIDVDEVMEQLVMKVEYCKLNSAWLISGN